MKKKIVLVFFLLIIISTLVFYYFNHKITTVEEKEVLVTGLCIGVDYENLSSTYQVGVMTAIDIENNTYTAFGHKINSNSEYYNLKNCYKAENINITKNENGNIGNLKGNIGKDKLGTILTNSITGISGQIENESIYELDFIKTYVGSRYKIKNGEAELYINLDGTGLQKYKVYIDNINFLDKSKNIHIKVIDNNLIEKTGGIIQGMSGSPIIQDGKFIGAINCVFQKDAKDGYAVFADKLF